MKPERISHDPRHSTSKGISGDTNRTKMRLCNADWGQSEKSRFARARARIRCLTDSHGDNGGRGKKVTDLYGSDWYGKWMTLLHCPLHMFASGMQRILTPSWRRGGFSSWCSCQPNNWGLSSLENTRSRDSACWSLPCTVLSGPEF